jgi:uncharacterized membrane protein
MSLKNTDKGYALDWKTLKQDWPLWIFLAGLILAAFLLYPMLPDKVPAHWNIHGEIDRYSSRAFGAFFAPLLALGLYLLMIVLPVVDPRRDNYTRFAGAYRLIRWGLVIFMAALYAVTVGVALGYNLNAGLFVKAGIALLLTLLGNVMGQLKHNYFVGIRTPWTLASEEVWRRTHRFASWFWVIGGLVCLAAAPIQSLWGAWVFFGSIAVIALVPIIFSYIVFRRVA